MGKEVNYPVVTNRITNIPQVMSLIMDVDYQRQLMFAALDYKRAVDTYNGLEAERFQVELEAWEASKPEIDMELAQNLPGSDEAYQYNRWLQANPRPRLGGHVFQNPVPLAPEWQRVAEFLNGYDRDFRSYSFGPVNDLIEWGEALTTEDGGLSCDAGDYIEYMDSVMARATAELPVLFRVEWEEYQRELAEMRASAERAKAAVEVVTVGETPLDPMAAYKHHLSGLAALLPKLQTIGETDYIPLADIPSIQVIMQALANSNISQLKGLESVANALDRGQVSSFPPMSIHTIRMVYDMLMTMVNQHGSKCKQFAAWFTASQAGVRVHTAICKRIGRPEPAAVSTSQDDWLKNL